MKKFNADFRGGVFRAAAIGTCLALLLGSAPASFGQAVYELEDYSDRLMAINVLVAHENFSGTGAALVQLSNSQHRTGNGKKQRTIHWSQVTNCVEWLGESI